MPICGEQACAWTLGTPPGATVNFATATLIATLSSAVAKLPWARSEEWVIGNPSVETSGCRMRSSVRVRRAYDRRLWQENRVTARNPRPKIRDKKGGPLHGVLLLGLRS